MHVGYAWCSGNYLVWMPEDLYAAKWDHGAVVERSDVSFLERTNFWDLTKRMKSSNDDLGMHIEPADQPALHSFLDMHPITSPGHAPNHVSPR